MASPTQKGFLRLEGGSLGDTTFVKSKDGHRARTKKSMSDKRWKTAREFARSRENAEEFGTSSTAAKLLKKPLYKILGDNVHTIAFQRLKVFLSKLVGIDHINLRGKRNILAENASSLIGFELNGSASLRTVFNTRFSSNLNRESGELGFIIPSFIPTQKIKAPKGTTHFKFITAGATIDFDKRDAKYNNFESDYIPYDNNPLDDLEINIILPPNSPHPIFVYLGLSFWQLTLGETHPVAQYRLNPAAIVNVFV